MTHSLEINRRSLITGLISLVAAPAIVRVASIMPVKSYIQSGFTASGGAVGYSLTTESHAAFYARLKQVQDGLTASGIWDKLDSLYLFGEAPTEGLARTNWKRVLDDQD